MKPIQNQRPSGPGIVTPQQRQPERVVVLARLNYPLQAPWMAASASSFVPGDTETGCTGVRVTDGGSIVIEFGPSRRVIVTAVGWLVEEAR
jgi:hypothetical protein